MSSWQCTVCEKWEDACDCELVPRARWDAARAEWTRLRRYTAANAMGGSLDALFFNGDETAAPAIPTITGPTED